jgi:hypothetical protein
MAAARPAKRPGRALIIAGIGAAVLAAMYLFSRGKAGTAAVNVSDGLASAVAPPGGGGTGPGGSGVTINGAYTPPPGTPVASAAPPAAG